MSFVPHSLLPPGSPLGSAAQALGPLLRPPAGAAARHHAAGLMLRLAHRLQRLARRLRHRPPPPRLPPELEFYAEASAPEGALYLDGELVGYLPVTRL